MRLLNSLLHIIEIVTAIFTQARRCNEKAEEPAGITGWRHEKTVMTDLTLVLQWICERLSESMQQVAGSAAKILKGHNIFYRLDISSIIFKKTCVIRNHVPISSAQISKACWINGVPGRYTISVTCAPTCSHIMSLASYLPPTYSISIDDMSLRDV